MNAISMNAIVLCNRNRFCPTPTDTYSTIIHIKDLIVGNVNIMSNAYTNAYTTPILIGSILDIVIFNIQMMYNFPLIGRDIRKMRFKIRATEKPSLNSSPSNIVENISDNLTIRHPDNIIKSGSCHMFKFTTFKFYVLGVRDLHRCRLSFHPGLVLQACLICSARLLKFISIHQGPARL